MRRADSAAYSAASESTYFSGSLVPSKLNRGAITGGIDCRWTSLVLPPSSSDTPTDSIAHTATARRRCPVSEAGAMPVPAGYLSDSPAAAFASSASLIPPPPINTQQPGVVTSLLYSGSKFRGHQKSKGNSYDVEVVLQVGLLWSGYFYIFIYSGELSGAFGDLSNGRWDD